MTGLNRLLRPKSIAVVGGGSWCANVIEQCQRIGFDGAIWSVHPTRSDVAGVPAFASVDALPAAPDACFVGVNRDATIDVVGQLAAHGSGGAVCFASGFLEAQGETGDGADLQAALLAAAGDMAVVGPNCYGFLNYLDGVALWPDQHGGEKVAKGVAIITQSSNIAINLTMQRRGLPIAYMLTTGNQAQTDMADMGMTVLDDPRVTTLGLYIEGINDLRKFEALANKARALGKPIVALKVGASDQAQAATVTHTASLAGSDAGAAALFKRFGIGRVRSLSALLETLKLLHVAGPLSSNRIASMSCSGGEACLMSDLSLGTNLTFPPLTDDQIARLRQALGGKVALANPLDYHTYIWGDVTAMTATFTAMMTPDTALGVVVLDFPRDDRCAPGAWLHVIEAVAATMKATGRPMAILGSLVETMPEDIAKRLIDMGVTPFCGMAEAMEAMDVAAALAKAVPNDSPVLLPRALDAQATLSEAEAKAALSAFGVPVPKAKRATSADDAGRALHDLTPPVALKGEGIAHKAEAGAVVLNLKDRGALVACAAGMPADTFLVEEMVTGVLAELLIGVVVDPAHGYVLTLGAGGKLAELWGDTACLLLPTTADEVQAALADLKISRVLDGYRGSAPVDKDAIVAAVMAVQDYVMAQHPSEVEINPLMCGADFAIAADALIRTRRP